MGRLRLPRLGTLLVIGILCAAVGCTDDGSGGSPASTTASGSTAGAYAPRSSGARVVARHGDGFLERDGARRILHLKGTPRERGIQHGYLLADEIEAAVDLLALWLQRQPGVPAQLQPLAPPIAATLFRPRIPSEAMEEIRGILEGVRSRKPGTWLSLDDLIFMNVIVDLGGCLDLRSFRCSGMAVWGSRTEGDDVIQTRNIDLMVGTGLEDHWVTIVNKPDGGVPWVSASWAGFAGCVTGLNAHGVGMSQIWAFSDDTEFGEPWPMTVNRIMGSARNVDDAVRAFRNVPLRTYGSNFVFGDRGDGRGGRPSGASIESSARHLAVFGPDDPAEDRATWQGQPYAIRLPEAVLRADCYMDPLLRSTQSGANGPTGDPRTAGSYRNRYEGQAAIIQDYERRGVPMGVDEAKHLARSVAMRNASLQCAVYENTDLALWVASARIGSNGPEYAYTQPFHRTDLDFFLPTVEATPDRSNPVAGDVVGLDLSWAHLGRPRRLRLKTFVERNGQRHSLSASSGTFALPEGGDGPARLDVTIPSWLGGDCALIVEAYEAGTQDLVDRATCDLTVR